MFLSQPILRLTSDLTSNRGAADERRDTYRVTRLAEAPPIEVYIVQSDYFSGDNQWGGVGDLGGTTVHAAVANAIYTATGVRVRRLPLKNFDSAIFSRHCKTWE